MANIYYDGSNTSIDRITHAYQLQREAFFSWKQSEGIHSWCTIAQIDNFGRKDINLNEYYFVLKVECNRDSIKQ